MPDVYYLSSLDSKLLKETRECVFVRRMHFDSGKEIVLAKIDPPLLGQKFGLYEDVDTVIFANRHKGESLPPVANFPCFVFVARPIRHHIEMLDVIGTDDVEIVGWGELYRTRTDADNHVF